MTLSSKYLVECDWLEENLTRHDIRIIDCHCFLDFDAKGNPSFTSGREAWEAAHIPGSCFIDLLTEASEQDTDLHFMMPSRASFEALLLRKGIDHKSCVVLYDGGENKWACRLWWMLKHIGFDNISVLNGGWRKWQAEGREIGCKPGYKSLATGSLQSNSVYSNLFVVKSEVINSLDDLSAKRVCALENDMFAAAHIPDSINIALSSLFDLTDSTFLPAAELDAIFRQKGLDKGERIFVYCGGGVAASCEAFALHIAGYESVSVYDGSMEEWAQDSALPVSSLTVSPA